MFIFSSGDAMYLMTKRSLIAWEVKKDVGIINENIDNCGRVPRKRYTSRYDQEVIIQISALVSLLHLFFIGVYNMDRAVLADRESIASEGMEAPEGKGALEDKAA